MTESHHGRPHCTANTPEQAPTNAATEPTDRSMWPAMMTITMPIARTRMYPFCTTRFEMFCGRSRMPSVRIANRIDDGDQRDEDAVPAEVAEHVAQPVGELVLDGIDVARRRARFPRGGGFGFDMVSPCDP